MSLVSLNDTDNLPANVTSALESIPWATEDDAQIRIALSILEAETPEEALTPPETKLGLRHKWVGKVFRILSASWVESTIEGQPLGRYLFCECATTDGEPFSGTIGGLNVMMQLARISELGGFPVTVRLEQVVSTTHPDRKALWLVRVGGKRGEEF